MRQDQPQRACILQPTLPLRLRWEPKWNLSVNRNAVAPVLKAGVFHLRLYAAGHNPFRVGKIVASGSQGSRNGNLGLEDGTALRLERQISVTYFQLAYWTGIKSLTEPAAED